MHEGIPAGEAARHGRLADPGEQWQTLRHGGNRDTRPNRELWQERQAPRKSGDRDNHSAACGDG